MAFSQAGILKILTRSNPLERTLTTVASDKIILIRRNSVFENERLWKFGLSLVINLACLREYRWPLRSNKVIPTWCDGCFQDDNSRNSSFLLWSIWFFERIRASIALDKIMLTRYSDVFERRESRKFPPLVINFVFLKENGKSLHLISLYLLDAMMFSITRILKIQSLSK